MVRNYLISLYRSIVKDKFYTFLNLFGLALGLATVLLILLYVQDELSFDRYHKNRDRIYRVESEMTVRDNSTAYSTAPIPLGPAMKREIPEIEAFVRIDIFGKTKLLYEELEFTESNLGAADSSLFLVFSHELISGNPKTCLSEPFSIVLSETSAEKYFGSDNPMGEIIADEYGYEYKVTGVFEDLPSTSHLKFDALFSIASFPDRYNTTKASKFWQLGVHTFIMLYPDASLDVVHEKFIGFYKEQMEPLGQKYGVSYKMMTTPLVDTHFSQGLKADFPNGNRSYILIFSFVALFVLIIASINYMNMATARAVNRAKEVGVRKVLGSYRQQLILQFTGESVVLAVFSMIFALLIVWLLLPEYNNFIDKQLSLNLFQNPLLTLEIFGITLFLGVVSGSYPAFYLSSFIPVKVLKGITSRTGLATKYIRKGLVVLQFFIAIFMIISSIVITRQIDFMKNSDLGFQKDNTIVVEHTALNPVSAPQAFIDEIEQHAGIVSATNSSSIAGVLTNHYNMKVETEEGMSNRSASVIFTDFSFIDTYGMQVVAGRDFNPEMGTDALEAVIVNETAAKEFGWGDKPLGKKINFGVKQDGSGGRYLKVIGVVKDFYFQSLHNAIEPMVIFISESKEYFTTLRLNPEQEEEVIDFLSIRWNEFYPNTPFQFRRLENYMDDQYTGDKQTAFLINLATLLMVFIALLGLLGLSSFVVSQRTKEIGMRKILGASSSSLISLLSKDFLQLIFVAFIMATPLAWWQLNDWLNANFVYHITIHWSTFVLAGIVSLVIGFLAISMQLIRALRRNPIEAIKYE